MVADKYIGLALAILSTLAIGTSFVVTKLGLQEASKRHGFEGDGFAYLKSPIWWGGITTMVVGEVANFAAYAFAPAILVTPLGALSVLIGAVLGAWILKEELGTLGKLGCAMCLIGSVIIVLHAPPDKELENVDQILHYAIHPGTLEYSLSRMTADIRTSFSTLLCRCHYLRFHHDLQGCSSAWQEKPTDIHINMFDRRIRVYYGSQGFWHCSQVDHGRQQPVRSSFHLCLRHCRCSMHSHTDELLQQGFESVLYFIVSTTSPRRVYELPLTDLLRVNPLYYVTFTTATLCASFILFQGFNTTDAVNTISLLSGFLVIFTGVYLLNLSRGDPDGHKLLNGSIDDGVPTDGITGLQTRRSMQTRRSIDHRRLSTGSVGYGHRGDRQGLIHSYDEENGGFGLTSLSEDSDEEPTQKRPSMNGRSNSHSKYPNESIR